MEKYNTILVTGGAGFIGSNFIYYMLKEHPEMKIVNLDILNYAGNEENLIEAEKNPNYTFVKGDIADEKLVNELFDKYDFDAVVNFAAQSHVDRSIFDVGPFIETNIMGTKVLMDAARRKWMVNDDDQHPVFRDGVRFHQVSTDEVYGALEEDGGFFTEETPLQSNNPYSATKAAADLLARSFHNTYNFPVTITRCSNNYGPYQYPEKLIPITMLNTLNKKKTQIYGDGKNIRDWLYVDDHCSGIDAVLHKGEPGQVYNIGGNNEKTNVDIVGICQTLTKDFLGKNTYEGIDVKPEEIGDDLTEFIVDRPGHDRRYAIDNTKITTELGWSPAYTFDDGVTQTIEWYLKNYGWLERLMQRQDYQDYIAKKYREE